MNAEEPASANLAIVRQIDIEAKARNWSRAELLRRAGVSSSSYARYASGERAMGVDVLLKVAGALKLQPSVLLERAEERYKEVFTRPPTKIAAVETVEPAGERRASGRRPRRSAPDRPAKRRAP